MGRAVSAPIPATTPQLGASSSVATGPVSLSHHTSKMSSTCMVTLILERPKAPRIYKANTMVASSYVKARESIYEHTPFIAKPSNFTFHSEDVNYRLTGRAIELLPKLK